MIFSRIIRTFDEADWTGSTAWKACKFSSTQTFTAPTIQPNGVIQMVTNISPGFDNTGLYNNTLYAFFPSSYPASIRVRTYFAITKTSTGTPPSGGTVGIGKCNATATAWTSAVDLIDVAPLAAGTYIVQYEGAVYLDGNSTDGRGILLYAQNIVTGLSFKIDPLAGGANYWTGYTV